MFLSGAFNFSLRQIVLTSHSSIDSCHLITHIDGYFIFIYCIALVALLITFLCFFKLNHRFIADESLILHCLDFFIRETMGDLFQRFCPFFIDLDCICIFLITLLHFFLFCLLRKNFLLDTRSSLLRELSAKHRRLDWEINHSFLWTVILLLAYYAKSSFLDEKIR